MVRTAAAQALADGAIADRGHERLAECVGGDLAASREARIQRLCNNLAGAASQAMLARKVECRSASKLWTSR